MKGQWIGEYTGDNDGQLMVNIDDTGDHYTGVAYITPTNRNLPTSVAYVLTKNKEGEQEVEAAINPVDPTTGLESRWADIKHKFDSDIVHSNTARVKIKNEGNSLSIESTSNLGQKLISQLSKPAKGDMSKIDGQKMNWKKFKKHISNKSKTKYFFRGQQKPWRLCSSFHRRERYRISEFIKSDVPKLHQRLSAITKHYFNLDNAKENGAFFNLLQHHGYPTPLLDWTLSPYVAAFFAFRDLPINYNGDEFIRIFIFDSKLWETKFDQITSIDPPFPHLSTSEFLAIDNQRLIPQQSVTTVTNIDDIEAYVIKKEKETNLNFLEAIDIPANEREEVMDDLRFMGITPGSMFPGIDGICEEYRELNFEK